MGRLISAYRHHPHHGIPISQEIVGSWAHTTQARVSRLETGPPNQQLDRLLFWAELLGIPQRLLWFATPIKQESLGGDGLTVGIAHHDEQPDTSAAWLATLENLIPLADKMGWRSLVAFSAAQLNSLDREVKRKPTLKSELALADARWSEFMSWACANSGSQGSEQWLERAHTKAIEAEDDVLSSYVLMRRSQQAIDNGDAADAIRLSRTALKTNLPARIYFLTLARFAEGTALAGGDEGVELLRASSANVPPRVDQLEDRISGHCDARYVTGVTARCYYLLGRHQEAAAMLRDVIADSQSADASDTAMWTAHLAQAYSGSQPELAAVTAAGALETARRVRSARLSKALLPVAIALRPHREQEIVRNFLDRHRSIMVDLLSE